MKSLHVNGIRFAIVDEGSGPAVVLVHGFPLDHTIWEGQIGLLARHGSAVAGIVLVAPIGIPQEADRG